MDLFADAKALFYEGLAYLNTEDWFKAEASFKESLKLVPDRLSTLNNLATALLKLKKLDEAKATIEKALLVDPAAPGCWLNQGILLNELKRHAEALASYDQAIKLDFSHAEAHCNRGIALIELRRWDDALASLDEAIKLKPDLAIAHNNRGVALNGLRRWDEALISVNRAIEIKPDLAEAHNNRGVALGGLGRWREALASVERAIEIRPEFADAHFEHGNVLQNLGRWDESPASYGRALALDPDYEYLHGILLHAKMRVCDWADLERQRSELFQKIARNEKATLPFAVLALTDCLSLQRQAAEKWVNEEYPAGPQLPALAKYPRHKKIRIGYFSADFRDHPVAILTAGLFETHNRAGFEVFGFSSGPDTQGEMRRRLEAAFDKFIDVEPLRDAEVAALARRMEIDIAVDLGGFTEGSRPGIFAARAAPIQVSYIGYLGTLGASYMDYLIADAMLVPEAGRQHYSEKIVYLPNSFQVNDAKHYVTDKIFTRAGLGLPERGFVYCCFNNSYKITPDTFDIWMRILKRVEGSVLWLLESSSAAAANLRNEARARGVNAGRLIFAKPIALTDNLARYRAADLFLDTFPYNAGATASDALWAGLPVLTITGKSFASRMGASLLNAIHLPELVTSSREEYETRAIEIAASPDRIGEIKQKLAMNRLTTPLFDTDLFTRHFEMACEQMVERFHQGLPPEHIYARP